MRLNGWQRLWVLVCIIWSVLVAFGSVLLYMDEYKPYIDGQSFEDVFGRLSERSQRVLVEGRISEELGNESVVTVELPSGTRLSFAPETPIEQRHIIVDEYTDIEKTTKKLRYIQHIQSVGSALAFWLLPCIALYILGWAIGWVYRGFK